MLVKELDSEVWDDVSDFCGELDVKYGDEEFFAKKYAEMLWSFNPCNPDEFVKTIQVLDDEGEIKVFDVEAEADVKFHAYVKEIVE